MRLSPQAIERGQALVARRLGLGFERNRRADLEQGLESGFSASGLGSEDAYLDELEGSSEATVEWCHLVSRLTVGETSFFRDRPCFDALEGHVLPRLIAARRSRGTLRLRLWSAACATGEEPYSLAILLERLLRDREAWDLTILGTDLDPAALDRARRGIYRSWSLRNLPEEVRSRHFTAVASGRFRLAAAPRTLVRFEPVNLTRGVPASVSGAALDLILCRNVLMYLTDEAAGTVVGHLRSALAPDGWLVPAPAEAQADRFFPLVPVNFPGTIFFAARETARSFAPAGTHPGGLPLAAWRSVDAPAADPQELPPPAEPSDPAPLVDEVGSSVAAGEPGDGPAPPPSAGRLSQARALADRGRLDQALELCLALVEEEPLNAEGHGLLAAIHQERGETRAALASLRRGLYLDPDNPELHLAVGSLLLKLGQRRRAARHLETAARLGALEDAS